MALDSADRSVLWDYFSLKYVLKKSTSFVEFLNANTRSRVHAYGDLPRWFTTRSGVCQGCRLSPFFTLFIEMIMELVQSSFGNSGVDTYAHRKLSYLKYEYHVVPLSKNRSSCDPMLVHQPIVAAIKSIFNAGKLCCSPKRLAPDMHME